MNSPTWFAVIQIGGPVYAVGRTEDQALREAVHVGMNPRANIQTRVGLITYGPGTMMVLPATEQLARAVLDDGCMAYDLVDGIVCADGEA